MSRSVLVIAFFIITLSSCQKDEEEDRLISGKKWVLHSGRVYLEELEAPFNKLYFDHFGNGQNRSNMQAFDAFSLSLDSLYQHSTTWEFNARFVLNSKQSYDYEISNGRFYRVYGLENGSARIFEYVGGSADYAIFRNSGSYGSLNGKNIKWFSELLFTKNGIKCFNCLPAAIFPYQYAGIVPLTPQDTLNQTYPLAGTRWLLEKYRQGLFEEQINDTLHFTGPITYRVNNSTVSGTYSLSGADATGMRNFTLFECASLPSGTPAWTGKLASFAIQQGVISGLECNSYGGNLTPIQIWMKKLN